MAERTWTLSGEFMESCNCDYLCPCIYTNSKGEVTQDDCTSIHVYWIDHGRNSAAGAFAMGAGHGWYCLGCCWALMLLMFVGGTMNLLWMAVLTAFVLVEKLFPAGEGIARASGVAMMNFGAVLLMQV